MAPSTTDVIRRILSENPQRTIVDPSLTPAAVMLLLYPKDGEYCILLNKRTDQVEHHKGEISFPGGRKDDDDATLLDTAIRETHEEMGIRPVDVEVLGQIDDTPTNSGYLMSTFVGTIPYPYRFRPSQIEVAELLEIPIPTLMGPKSFRYRTWTVDGRPVEYPEYSYRGHTVWGATAKVLHRFLELLDTVPDSEAVWKRDLS